MLPFLAVWLMLIMLTCSYYKRNPLKMGDMVIFATGLPRRPRALKEWECTGTSGRASDESIPYI
jgi:hypothetical protein